MVTKHGIKRYSTFTATVKLILEPTASCFMAEGVPQCYFMSTARKETTQPADITDTKSTNS
jgi:hypothetical protein